MKIAGYICFLVSLAIIVLMALIIRGAPGELVGFLFGPLFILAGAAIALILTGLVLVDFPNNRSRKSYVGGGVMLLVGVTTTYFSFPMFFFGYLSGAQSMAFSVSAIFFGILLISPRYRDLFLSPTGDRSFDTWWTVFSLTGFIAATGATLQLLMALVTISFHGELPRYDLFQLLASFLVLVSAPIWISGFRTRRWDVIAGFAAVSILQLPLLPFTIGTRFLGPVGIFYLVPILAFVSSLVCARSLRSKSGVV